MNSESSELPAEDLPVYMRPEFRERRWLRMAIPQDQLRAVVEGTRRIRDVLMVPVGRPPLADDVVVHHCYYDVSCAAVIVILQCPRFDPVPDGEQIPWFGDIMNVAYEEVKVAKESPLCPASSAASSSSSRPTISSSS
jgi:hypothetical protein